MAPSLTPFQWSFNWEDRQATNNQKMISLIKKMVCSSKKCKNVSHLVHQCLKSVSEVRKSSGFQYISLYTLAKLSVRELQNKGEVLNKLFPFKPKSQLKVLTFWRCPFKCATSLCHLPLRLIASSWGEFHRCGQYSWLAGKMWPRFGVLGKRKGKRNNSSCLCLDCAVFSKCSCQLSTCLFWWVHLPKACNWVVWIAVDISQSLTEV